MKKILAAAVLFAVSAVGAFAAEMPQSFSDVAKKAGDGVVNISTTKMVTRQAQPFMNDDFFRYFFGGGMPESHGGNNGAEPKKYKTSALGSGFVIDSEGYVVTNNHVIEGADEIIIRFKDEKELKATLVGADPLTDLALLKVDPKGHALKPVPMGNSDAAEIGDWVLAIGNPYGLGGTVTAGIISAKGRVLGDGPYDNFIQTDASINPGNSGGPLINMKGEVVGVNTAIIQSGQGLGFAVPINMLQNILPKLKQGKVSRGWLGVTLQPLDEALAKSFGIPNIKGVLVADVMAGDPADRAGIKAGDVIVSVDGVPVPDSRALTRIVGGKSPNESINLGIYRDGRQMALTVKLGERPNEPGIASVPQKQQNRPLAVTPLSPEYASRLGVTSGVLVSDISEDTAAFKAGLRTGNVIVWFNRKNVESPKQFYDMLDKTKKGDVVALKIVTENGSRFVAFNKE